MRIREIQRMKHVIPSKIRKQANRSGTKMCPICETNEILVDHHLSGRKASHAQRQFNRADICSNCHAKLHHGLIVVEGWFLTTNGMKLLWHSIDGEPITDRIEVPPLIQSK